jgi:predicted XRE-type DNA-binding protein
MLSLHAMAVAIAHSGMTQAQIAQRLGTSQPCVHRLLKNKCRIYYDTGKHIEALYAERVGDAQS